METAFKLIYFAGIVGQVILRFPHERQYRQVEKTDRRISPAENALLAGLTLGSGVLPLIYSLTPWLAFADYPGSPAAKTLLGIGGVGFLAASLWLFGRSHHDLGVNWSPSLEINTQQTLVTQGVYARIRHPMYTSQLLWCIAQLFLMHNWIAGWAGLVAFLPMLLVRMPNEERMMLDHFGNDYRAYCARTGRIAPRLFG